MKPETVFVKVTGDVAFIFCFFPDHTESVRVSRSQPGERPGEFDIGLSPVRFGRVAVDATNLFRAVPVADGLALAKRLDGMRFESQAQAQRWAIREMKDVIHWRPRGETEWSRAVRGAKQQMKPSRRDLAARRAAEGPGRRRRNHSGGRLKMYRRNQEDALAVYSPPGRGPDFDVTVVREEPRPLWPWLLGLGALGAGAYFLFRPTPAAASAPPGPTQPQFTTCPPCPDGVVNTVPFGQPCPPCTTTTPETTPPGPGPDTGVPGPTPTPGTTPGGGPGTVVVGPLPGIGNAFLTPGQRVLLVVEEFTTPDFVAAILARGIQLGFTIQGIQVPSGVDPQVFATTMQNLVGNVDAVVQVINDNTTGVKMMTTAWGKKTASIIPVDSNESDLSTASEALAPTVIQIQEMRSKGIPILGDLVIAPDIPGFVEQIWNDLTNPVGIPSERLL